MDIGLLVTFAGVIVAGLAGLLGVWMERDASAPAKWGYAFSALIVIATGIELSHATVATAEQNETDEALARVLERMSDLAASGDNPALEQFVGAELAVQARANPDVVKKMEDSVAEKGGDPASIMKKASEGRRAAGGLPKKAPAAGETPTLGAAFAAQGKGKGTKRGKAAKVNKLPEEGLAAGLAAQGGAGLAAGLAGGGAKSLGDAKAAAVGDTKAAATKAMGDSKAAATKAVDDGKAAAAKAADDAKAEADKAAAEAAAQKQAAEDEARKKKEAADKAAADAKKAADQKKKEAEAAKDKARNAFGRGK